MDHRARLVRLAAKRNRRRFRRAQGTWTAIGVHDSLRDWVAADYEARIADIAGELGKCYGYHPEQSLEVMRPVLETVLTTMGGRAPQPH